MIQFCCSVSVHCRPFFCERWCAGDGRMTVNILKITICFVESKMNTIPVKPEKATIRLYSFCWWSLCFGIRIFLYKSKRALHWSLEPALRIEQLANKWDQSACMHVEAANHILIMKVRKVGKSRLINENKREWEDKIYWVWPLQFQVQCTFV